MPERLDEAVAIAARHDLTIDTVHYHTGYLYMSGSIPIIEEAEAEIDQALQELERRREE